MRATGLILLVVLFMAPLAGCIQTNTTDNGTQRSPDRTIPDSDLSWFNQSGVQCEQTPWQEWQEESGYRPRGSRADDAFVNDEYEADLIRAYYASKNVKLEDVQVYRDDLGRAQYCGNSDGRHYWIKTSDSDFQASTDGWEQTDQAPKTMQASDRKGVSETSWYTQSGVQCEPPPWQQWASDTGYTPENETTDEAYTNDPALVETIRAYYATKGVTFDDVRAYRDDQFYTSVCGAPDGRHYWVRSPDGPFDAEEDGWQRTDTEPAV